MTPVQPLRRRVVSRAFQAADVLVMVAASAVAFAVHARTVPDGWRQLLQVRVSLSNLLLFLGLCLLWHLIFRWGGLYRSRRIGPAEPEWWDVTKAVALGSVILGVIALVLDLSIVSRAFLGAFFAVALIGTQLMRSVLRVFLIGMRRHGRNLRRVVIVGCGPRGAWFGREIRNRPALGYLLQGYVDDIEPPVNPLHGEPERHLGSLAELESVLAEHDVDEVFIALPVKSYYETIAQVISLTERLGLPIRIPAHAFELQLSRASVDYLGKHALLTLETPKPSGGMRRAKRAIDLAGSSVALLFLLPVFALVALAIKLDSRGPVLFAQERVGLGGRQFRMLKFRTMVPDAEARLEQLEQHNEVRGAAFKMRRDPRVTRIGAMLRRFSVDELPQMLNVLKGNLSLVGPRPLPVRDVERMDARWQRRRFSVKPGLTCLWQVSGRHEISFEHWMELDLQYIDNWSLGLDVQILLRTVPAVLRGTGAS